MKKPLCLLFALLLFIPIGRSQTLQPELSIVKEEIVRDLRENILPFWMRHTPDPAGGFYGEVKYDGTPNPGAPKGLVLNARILWTFSAAYRLFGDKAYAELADRAQQYLIRYFFDTSYGGAYWSVDAEGKPLDMAKQTYGIAFGIYGLSEHYRATGNQQSLDKAIELYQTLEERAYDPVNGGYTESFTREWNLPERFGYDGKGIAAKTMNTHLHVLEAYTSLYRVWQTPPMQQSLRTLTHICIEKILDQHTWHEKLFLTADWQNLEEIESYGHDMEFSWLLTEAGIVLGDQPLLDRIREIAVRVVDTQRKEGMNPDGSIRYEKNGENIHANRDWWPQAETVVAFLNAWEISHDNSYKEGMIQTWNWIKANMIDTVYGEWYSTVRPDGTPNTKRNKADLWRCPYHNARMGMEVFERLH